MAASDPDEGFKVTDRRRRPEDDEPPRATEPVRPAAAPREAPVPPRETATQPRPAAPRPAPEPAAEPERSLVGLFMMLGSSAVIAMGEAPDPVTGQRHRDLNHSADVIDLLLLLREKTEGHRTPEETQVLEELVYDLQLRYVNATKRPGSPPGPARP